MLCKICRRIFTGERPETLWSHPHLSSVVELVDGVRNGCFICATLKRGISKHGELDEADRMLEDLGSTYYWITGQKNRDFIELWLTWHYSENGTPERQSRALFLRPWDGMKPLFP